MKILRNALLSLALVGSLTSLFAASIPIEGRDYTVLTKARHSRYDLTLPIAAGASRLDLVFAASDPQNYARLLWTADGLVLALTDAGRTQTLTQVNTTFPASLAKGGEVLLRRHRHRLEVIAAGRRVCRILAPPFGKGMVAVCTENGGATVAKPTYQPVEPVTFGDDFMRTEEEGKNLGLWKAVSGDWRMYSVMERIQANPDARIREGREPAADRSPNPFCLSGTGPEGAFILNGQPFWSDYRAGVSVRSMGSEFGLLFGAVDADTCWLARWRLHSLGVKPNLLELVRRQGGKEDVVASVQVVGRARGWYRLEAITLGSRIEVLVDGVSVLTHHDSRSVGGRIGLYAKGKEETLFDDVSLTSVQRVDLDDLSEFAAARRAVSGEWQVEGTGTGLSFAATTARRDLALVALGYDDWSTAGFAADVTAERNAVAGLVLGLRDAKNHLRAELGIRDRQARLIQVRDGKETTLAESPVVVPDGPVQLFVDMDASTHVRFFVNGCLVLRQPLAEAPAGPVGLAVRDKGTVQFRAVQAFAELAREWEHAVDIARFANDPFMQGWASPRYAWILAPGSAAETFPQRYIHKGDFYGPFEISLPIDNGLRLSFGGESVEDMNHYELSMQVASAEQGTLILTRQGKEIAKQAFTPGECKVLPGQQIVDEKIGALPKTPDTVSYGTLTMHRDGHELWADIDGKEVMSLHENEPLTGRTVTLDLPQALDLVHVGTVRAQVRDYLFEKAATDWVQVGSWEVTNRFACDPRWSHMNGRGKGTAALWNKLAFDGDFTLEYYAGMRMRQGEMHEGAAKMYYPRVGDINVAFGAKDMDLFSGYNVILQGWDPMWSETWSRFMRGGDIMAKNDRHLIPRGRHQRAKAREIEVAWDPGGRPVHGAWYYVKIRKTGGQFDVSFDNVPVFSVTDRDPLAGQRLALWTQHNSIVIARAKVGYRQATRPTPKVETKALAEPEARLSAPYRLRGLTQPGMLLDFESDAGGLLPFAGDQSAELRLVPRPKGEGQALRLENLYGGGDFGVAIPVHEDATRLSRIEFDYAMPAEAKLNLYVSLVERPHERWFVTLNGPAEEAPNLYSLGAFEGANADGKWHHASFDLGAALRRALPHEGPLHIRGLAIAMLHEGYLNAGLGGNPQGATWHLDNLLLRSHGPKQSLFAWTPLTTPAPTRYRAWFAPGSTVTAMPAGGEVRTGDSFTVELPAAGDWLVQAAVEIAGQWRPVPPVPVRVCEPVQIARTEPADKGTWDGGMVRVFLKPGQRANLDLPRCALKLGDARIPVAEHLARYDEEKGMLEFFPNPAGLQVPTATETALEFIYADDLLPTPLPKEEQEAKTNPTTVEVKAGDAAAAPVVAAQKSKPRALPAIPLDADRTHKWTMSLPEKGDKVAPSLVRLHSNSYHRLDFEDALGVLPLVGSEVLLQRVPRGDGHALRVVNRLCGSTFGAQLGWSGFDLGQNPILDFDYRVTEDANVGFEITLFGRKYILSLTDTDDTTATSLGQIPDVVADGTWQHARVDLTELVATSATAHGRARTLDVGGISVGDFGYAGDAPGAWYELDNLCLSRVASASKGLELRWAAHDAGGIAGYSYSWDDQPATDPDTTPETASGSATFGKLAEGKQFFHIRAIDRAGNAGPTSHYPFMIDNTPPEIVASSPVDGSKDAASELSVTFGESVSQINTGSAQIFVNKRRLPVRSGETEWDPEKRKLTVNLLADWSLMSKPLADGQEMQVRIGGLKDFAGNEAKPFEFSWKVDYSQDKEPPPAPYLWSSNGQFQAFDHFGNDRHTWRPYVRGAAATSSAERVQDEERGGWCLRVRKDEAGPRFGVHNYRSTDIETSPQMAFDIRIMPGTKVNALFYVDKKYYAVRLTGGDQLPIIGEVPGVTDDGKWHRVSFDAGKMLRKALPDTAEIKVRVFAIAGWSDGNEVGATFYLDNFGLIGPRPPLPLFSYSTTDATGITKYRIAFDQNPASTAGEETQGTQSVKRLLAADKPGMWYVHAAARDGAGNWSETVHYPYLCNAPVPESKEDGLEATARWRSAVGGGRVRGIVYQATTMGGNRLMGLQVSSSRQGNVGVNCQITGTPLSGKVKLSASVFSGAAEPMKMHAVLKGYSGRTLTSESVELKPEAWTEGVQFVFPEPLPTAGKIGARWSLSFTATVAKGARPVFLFDSVQLASMPPTEPGAGGE